MNIYSLFSILTLEVVITLGLMVYFKSPKNKLNRLFLILCIIQSYNIFVDFSLKLSPDYTSALTWMKMGPVWTLYLSYLLHFALFYTEKHRILKNKLLVALIYLPSGLTSILLVFDFIKVRPEKVYWGWVLVTKSNAVLFNVLLMILVVEAILALVLYWKYYKNTDEERKKLQSMFIMLGFVASIIMGSVTNGLLPLFNMELPGMTSVAIMLNSLFIGFAVWKYELFTLTAASAAEVIISTMNDALIVVTPESRIKIVNKSFLKMSGYQEDDVINKDISGYFEEMNTRDYELFKEGLSHNGNFSDIELSFFNNSGSRIPVSLSGSIIRSNPQTVQGIILVARDISERKKSETELQNAKTELDQLLRKEKDLNDMKSRFISNVSHEYRTPLTVILSSTYLLGIFFDKGQKEDFDKHIRMIQNAIKSMTQLLENVLTFGRSDSGRLKINPVSMNICRFVDDILFEHKLIDNNNHEFEYSCSIDNCIVNTDEKLLRLIVSNLLSNAVKYSDKGSLVSLELSNQTKNIYIKISDRGRGIPDEEKKYLFEPFYRGKNIDAIPGTGLGLAIVKRSVDLLNGNISVDSRLDKGTVFNVEIPVIN